MNFRKEEFTTICLEDFTLTSQEELKNCVLTNRGPAY